MHRTLRACCYAAISGIAVAGCSQPDHSKIQQTRTVGRSEPLAGTVRLQDDTFNVLAKPIMVSRNSTGEFAVADASDRDVKVYDADGRRLGTIGSAGRRSGQFTHLSGAQYLGDSLLGYDFNTGRLSVFSPATGAVTRTMSPRPAPFDVRVLDDSLLLFIRHPGQGGPLLTVARRDGQATVSFFEANPFAKTPELRFLSAVYADGRDGVVYAGLFGIDSLFTFDYSGREIATVLIPSSPRLDRLELRLSEKGGAVRGADSSWFHDGANALMGMVALNDGDVALQVAKYDARLGTDLLRSESEIVLVHADARTPIREIGHSREVGLLLGRDVDGAPLFVSASTGPSSAGLVLSRRRIP